MRSLRLFVAITLALAGLGLLAVVMAAPATRGPGEQHKPPRLAGGAAAP
jgi:hypothetical protein